MEESRDQALARMVALYEAPLLRVCCIYLKDRALAEDAVQETWLKAYGALDKFRGECSEKTWLMRIAMNTCRDMRRTAWYRHVDRRVSPDLVADAYTSFAWCDDVVQAIQQLPAKQREVVLLYYYQDMTMAEVGHALGIATSTVDKRLKRAHQRLEQLLGEEASYERA